MIRTGEVVGKADGILSVVFERPEACTQCNGCLKRDCAHVDIPGEADIGDSIDVEMPGGIIVGASAIAYIVPLVSLLLGLLSGAKLQTLLGVAMDANLFSALCALLGLALGLLVASAVDKTLRNRRQWQPKVVAVHKQTE